jgi:hypothetical protein
LLSKSETDPTRIIYKLGKAVSKAQKSVTCSTTFPLFVKVKQVDEKIWSKAVKRGVEFKFIISGVPKGEEFEVELSSVLKNADCFKIRCTPAIVPVCVLLVDENEAFCRMGDKMESPVLWSANPNFVAMIKDYLETKWKSLEPRALKTR